MVCEISFSLFSYIFSPVLFFHLCILVFFVDGNFCFTIREAHDLRVLENKVLGALPNLKLRN